MLNVNFLLMMEKHFPTVSKRLFDMLFTTQVRTKSVRKREKLECISSWTHISKVNSYGTTGSIIKLHVESWNERRKCFSLCTRHLENGVAASLQVMWRETRSCGNWHTHKQHVMHKNSRNFLPFFYLEES